MLDKDSSESPTYSEQEGGAHNGHFGCTCYHPLFVFNQLGDVERCALRSGNVHSADGWRAVLEPVVARYRGIVRRLYFRGDAAFANPEIYEFLEAERIGYTIRLAANGADAHPVRPNRIDCACRPLYRRLAAFGDSEETPEPAHRSSPTMGFAAVFSHRKILRIYSRILS